MRILIVHNTLNDSKSISGALRHFLFVAEEWSASGHTVDFLVARAGFPQIRRFAPHCGVISSDNLYNATRYLERTSLYFPAYAHRLMTAHWVHLQRYDIVIASTQLIVEVYPAMVIARRHKARLVAKVHHVLAAQQTARSSMIDQLFLWSERRTTRWLSRHADLVICGTRFVERDYKKLEERLGVPPAPTAVSGYGVDLAQLPDSSEFPKTYDVVHLGRLHEHKGVLHLPKVWKLVVAQRPNARLIVIGEGPHRLRTEQMFREEGLEETVVFTGGIPEKEKNELLGKSKIGLSLSFEEGWGLSVNDFLASGLPVVAYALPIFDDVFPKQLYGVPVGDYTAAAKEILRLLAGDEERIVSGKRGRQFVMQYDFKTVARHEMQLLEKVLNSPKHGH